MANLEGAPGNTGSRTPATLFAAYVEFMKLMLGNLFLINAGSAVALLTFLGGARDKPTGPPVTGMPNQSGLIGPPLVSNAGAKGAIIIFGAGALLSVVAAALMAWQENQNSNALEQGEALGWRFGILGLVSLISSAFAFGIACGYAVTY